MGDTRDIEGGRPHSRSVAARSSRARARGKRTSTAAAVVAAALAVAGSATVADAQLGDPGVTLTETSGGVGDTDYTPVAKGSERWESVAGARFSTSGPAPADVPVGSVTPFELDFFDVAFHDPKNGLAGGAECREPVPVGASDAEARAHTASCERVPVIYRYSVNDLGDATWAEVHRGEGRGYVGQIAWLDGEHALAVGGSGCYTRREEDCPDGTSAEGDDPRAGRARAWLYKDWDGDGELRWRELAVPAQMRGLTALAVEPKAFCQEGTGPDAVRAEWGCAAVGGLRQIWHFRDGAFVRGWSGDGSTALAVVHPELFRFRVRDIRGTSAVTAGCCTDDPLHARGPRTLSFDGSNWVVPTGQGDAGSQVNDPLYAESQREQRPIGELWETTFERPHLVTGGMTPYEAAGEYVANGGPCTLIGSPAWKECGRKVYQEGFRLGAADLPPLEPITGVPWPLTNPLPPAPQHPAEEQDDAIAEAHRRASGDIAGAAGPFRPVGVNPSYAVEGRTQAQTPDSHYAIFSGGTLSSPGGPAPAPGEGEPASQITGGACCPALSSARLVAIDTTPVTGGIEAVGELRSTGQGLAFGPQERFPNRFDSQGCEKLAQGEVDCSPDAQRFIDAWGSLRLFKLPSYALNSVEVADAITGAGWAVGDHGAILALAGESAAQVQAQEPDPPRLATREPGRLPDPEPYERYRQSVTDEPGLVPSLAARPLEELREPRFVSAGVPNGRGAPVDAIAIGRDGSEGWAFGSGTIGASGGSGSGDRVESVYRYDGSEWRVCVPHDPGADPACASLAPFANLTVRDVERVPLERDGDPANDDELELAAIAAPARLNDNTPGGLLRYRAGRWQLDAEARVPGTKDPIRGHDIAFTAPDDGWVVDNSKAGTTFEPMPVYRFDGERWMRCTGSASQVDAGCGDPDGRLSVRLESQLESQPGAFNFRGLRLTVAGERLYAFATRGVGGSGNLSKEVYPMIVYRDAEGSCTAQDDTGCWRGGEDDTDDGVYNPTDGGWDPARYVTERERVVEPPKLHGNVDGRLDDAASDLDNTVTGDRSRNQGRVYTVALAATDGGVEGWAVGSFGGVDSTADAGMLRLEDGSWGSWAREDAADEHLRGLKHTDALDPRSHITLPAAIGKHSSFVFQTTSNPASSANKAPALAFNEERERWEALATPWLAGRAFPGLYHASAAAVKPVVADAQGGLWVGVKQGSACSGSCAGQFAFLRYTDRTPRPVFDEAPNPARNTAITAMAAAADGTL